MTQAGPAIPVIAVTDRAADGGPALRVAVVSDGRPTEGGPARPVIVVTDGRPTQGNEPLPIIVATGAQATHILAGPAIPVVVVSGSLSSGVAPANTVLPVISGTTDLGATLSTTNGTWTGTAPITFAYQWKRNGVVIGGATNSTYVLVSADLGTTITVTVTATNAIGVIPATSVGTTILNWIVHDRFTTPAAAPLASPRTCEPGPGTLTITDTINKLSTTGTLLRAITGTAANDPRAASPVTIASVPGRVLYCTFKLNTGGDLRAGFRPDAVGVANNGISLAALTLSVIPAATTAYNFFNLAYIVGTTYELLVVLRGDWTATSNGGNGGGGCVVFVRGGIYTNWTLVGTANQAFSDLTSVNVGNVAAAATGGFDIGNLSVYDVAGALGTLYPYATIWAAYPFLVANPTTWTITADAFIECAYHPAVAEVFEIRTRYTDDNNCWIVRCNVAGSTLKLIEKVAGVETERATTAQTWTTAGTVYYRIRVGQKGVLIRVILLDGGVATLNYASAASNQTATGLMFTGGATVTDAVAWPLTFAAIDITTPATTPVLFLPYGDSITVGTGDSTPPATGLNGYPPILADLATTTTRGAWEFPARIAAGGRTTATAKAAVDAELAAKTTTPTHITYNLGANDLPLAMGQAAWQANALYIWDAMHVKWPNALIYVMKIWVRGQDANCNTYDDTWLPTAVALRSSFVFLNAALDERIILEAGDNGVTYTVDGTHPNRAGCIRMATAFKTAMGL